MLRLHTLFVFLFFVFISAYGAQTYSVKGVVTSHATGDCPLSVWVFGILRWGR